MKQYALLGKSLSHSFSASFFEKYFTEKGIDAKYSNLELADVADFMLYRNQFDGFNVTIPYKESIIPFLDGLDDVASVIGAVNTIKLDKGKAIGYNTDAFGFRQMIKPFLTNKHERALIIGTGGASKAVSFVLSALGVTSIWIARSPARKNEFSYHDINKVMLSTCKLIVNCTPIGMFPQTDDTPLIELEGIGKEHLVIDLIYNPEKTRLLLEAESHGAQILNGYGMLQEQALKAYEVWNS